MLLSEKTTDSLETLMESLCGSSMLKKQNQPKLVSGLRGGLEEEGLTGYWATRQERCLDLGTPVHGTSQNAKETALCWFQREVSGMHIHRAFRGHRSLSEEVSCVVTMQSGHDLGSCA